MISNNEGKYEFFYYSNQNDLKLLASSLNEQYRHYHINSHYSISAISDPNGLLDQFKKSFNTFDPYGNPLESFSETGIIQIEENIFWFRKRLYHSKLGRFMSFDSEFLSGSKTANMYVYCDGDPVNLIDPYGTKGIGPLGIVMGLLDIAVDYALDPKGFDLSEALVTFADSALSLGTYKELIKIVKDLINDLPSGKVDSTYILNKVANLLLASFTDIKSGNRDLFNKLLETVTDCVKNLANKLADKDKKCFIDYHSLINECLKQLPKKFLELAFNKYYKLLEHEKLKFIPEFLLKIAEKILSFVSDEITELVLKYFLDKVEKCDDPGSKPGPGPPPVSPVWPVSLDPNEIIRHGQIGYGQLNFIQQVDEFNYTILFENYFNASAPARDVLIELKIDIGFDINTFYFTAFGFGNYSFELDPKQKVNHLIKLPNFTDYYVDFASFIDRENRLAYWKFVTLDNETLQPTENVDIGFLPPNKFKSGEGFVRFKVNRNENCTTMCELKAKAKIIFDLNDPILTNTDVCTIDDNSPDVLVYYEENEKLKISNLVLKSKEEESGINYLNIFIKDNSTNEYKFDKKLPYQNRIILDFLESNKTYEIQIESVDN
ncbi:unnamed protein product, partial [Brachionus calyciflorus]